MRWRADVACRCRARARRGTRRQRPRSRVSWREGRTSIGQTGPSARRAYTGELYSPRLPAQRRSEEVQRLRSSVSRLPRAFRARLRAFLAALPEPTKRVDDDYSAQVAVVMGRFPYGDVSTTLDPFHARGRGPEPGGVRDLHSGRASGLQPLRALQRLGLQRLAGPRVRPRGVG